MEEILWMRGKNIRNIMCVYKEIDEGGGGSRYLRKEF